MAVPPFLSSAVSPASQAGISAFDQRIVQVDIAFDDGPITFGSGAAIYISGRKYGSAIMNECEVRIFNLTRDQRNYILTKASPLKSPRTPIDINVRVGRVSYGTFLLFTGQVISCNITQPPDIGISLRSLTSNYFTGAIKGAGQPAISSLRSIAQSVANNFTPPLSLDFQATDRQINNFSLNGAATNGIVKLEQIGGINAFIDNNTLVVIDSSKAKQGETILINEAMGMVGIPQVTDQGVIVTIMLNNQVELGSSVQVESVINPAANGIYKVVKISFEIASRDPAFWYILECSNLAYYQGTI